MFEEVVVVVVLVMEVNCWELVDVITVIDGLSILLAGITDGIWITACGKLEMVDEDDEDEAVDEHEDEAEEEDDDEDDDGEGKRPVTPGWTRWPSITSILSVLWPVPSDS